MRFVTSVLPLALLAATASAAPVERGSLGEIAEVLGQDLEIRTPQIDPQTNIPMHLEKRTFTVQLKADTSTVYRATINGVAVFIHMYFDLAINRAIFYWELQKNVLGPPKAFNIGFRDITKHLFQAAVALGPGQHQVIYNAAPGNTITVFKHDSTTNAKEDVELA
ncbi:hypothetical protein B9Z65_8153 [Elsinoe australis]|uniref:Uncharacterized protein n=1 Tax=Elsinoe australis TaxID=40998 RepID=A0A2P7YW72_9PEZI|nr:hypothetical protein B9Z65_8153 [Elsinoe australis]